MFTFTCRDVLVVLLWKRKNKIQPRCDKKKHLAFVGHRLKLTVHVDHFFIPSGVCWIEVFEKIRTQTQGSCSKRLVGKLLYCTKKRASLRLNFREVSNYTPDV